MLKRIVDFNKIVITKMAKHHDVCQNSQAPAAEINEMEKMFKHVTS